MNKPTIFFSHSSHDKEHIVRLKDVFIKKTGGTIDVFVSSDGQSIPLGRNWVYKIQEGLEKAALMIVFVTPASINSKWIYFEAGYSHAKGIQVVPAGMLGIDLTQIGAPLNLLQGFNIKSADTLNNLIALANTQFSHNHQLTFTETEANDILCEPNKRTSGAFDKAQPLIEEIKLEIEHTTTGLSAPAPESLVKVDGVLKNENAKHYFHENKIIGRGFTIIAKNNITPTSLCITIDPIVFRSTLPLIEKVLASVLNQESALDYYFHFKKNISIEKPGFKLTAKLHTDDISIIGDRNLEFKNILFTTGFVYPSMSRNSDPTAYLSMCTYGSLDIEAAASLLDLLIEREVIRDESANGYIEI